MELEAIRLAELHRQLEEEKLRKAIEEQKQREKEEQEKKQEEARLVNIYQLFPDLIVIQAY